MKVKAAICLEPQKPLVIDEIDLAAPREGECLVRLAATGVCHTDAYTLSGADPEGLFPADRSAGSPTTVPARRPQRADRKEEEAGWVPLHASAHATIVSLY